MLSFKRHESICRTLKGLIFWPFSLTLLLFLPYSNFSILLPLFFTFIILFFFLFLFLSFFFFLFLLFWFLLLWSLLLSIFLQIPFHLHLTYHPINFRIVAYKLQYFQNHTLLLTINYIDFHSLPMFLIINIYLHHILNRFLLIKETIHIPYIYRSFYFLQFKPLL